MPCRGKIAPNLEETCFLFCLIIALRATEIKPEILGKARILLMSMGIFKQGKTNMNHKALPVGTRESLRRNQN